jgi:cell division inhibitor SulA
LVEVCQPGALQGPANTGATSQGEWLLFAPSLHQLKEGYTVLLNPPATPFAPSLIQAGIDLDRLLIVEAEKKADFLASFTELARADICVAIMAWQPKQNLNYTELRKCQLACSDGKGLYILFRPISVQRQSSPAALRLRAKLHFRSLEVQIFKQKGLLSQASNTAIHLPVPETWLPVAPHAHLGHDATDSSRSPINNISTITGAKRNLP